MVIRDKWQFSYDKKTKKLKIELLLFDDRVLQQFIIDRIRVYVHLTKINNGGTFVEEEGIIGRKEFYRDSHTQIQFGLVEEGHFYFDFNGYIINGFQENLVDIQKISSVELCVIDGTEFKVETFKKVHTFYHIEQFSISGIKNIVVYHQPQ
jgi:hypothetical protein